MLLDLITGLSIVLIVFISLTGSIRNMNRLDGTLLTSILLMEKFNAINTNETKQIVIKDELLSDTNIKIKSDDCTLSWAKAGTTSKSGTCTTEYGNITLRPGEGGMGYEWKK